MELIFNESLAGTNFVFKKHPGWNPVIIVINDRTMGWLKPNGVIGDNVSSPINLVSDEKFNKVCSEWISKFKEDKMNSIDSLLNPGLVSQADLTYGLWRVTTEGGADGRKAHKELGVYEGYVDEIALHLANEVCYNLEFTPLKTKRGPFSPAKNTINVKVLYNEDLRPVPSKWSDPTSLFKYRNVFISRVNSQYNNVGFTISLTDEDIKKAKKEAALAKLSDEEKEILGL